MRVGNLRELREAVKRAEPEIVVPEPWLASKVRAWETLRKVANGLVFAVLALALFAWADPLGWSFLHTSGARLGRQVLLGFGVVLLFVEYLLPAVRHYKVTGQDEAGLKLVSRRPSQGPRTQDPGPKP